MKLLNVFFLLLISYAAFAQDEVPMTSGADQKAAQMKIKTMKIKTCTEYLFDDDTKVNEVSSVKTYDANGKLLSEIIPQYGADTLMTNYAYDANMLSKATMIHYDVNPIEMDYQYNAKGEPFHMTVKDADKLQYEYSFNNNEGKVVRAIAIEYYPDVDDNGTPTGKTDSDTSDIETYFYGDKGELMKLHADDAEAGMYEITYVYNADGTLQEEADNSIDEDSGASNVATVVTYQYDGSGFLKEKDVKDAEEGETYKYTYQYVLYK